MEVFFRGGSNLNPYIPVLIFIAVAVAFGLGTLVMTRLVRPNRPYAEKLSPYECGNPPLMEARERFYIRFYLIAILFVLFDVEAIFLYPWAVLYGKIGLYGFVEMMIFIAILLVGYLYAWRKGALEWVKED